MTQKRHSSSFRDPSGYVYIDDSLVKRIIFPSYFKQFETLESTGFFKKLFKNKLLVSHEVLEKTESRIVIQPEQIPFITYPYEWSFYQYKEAALLTLKIQKYSLEHGFSLKDASAFNITFHKGQAVFIDTLSFDFYKENTPWRAYKQFVTHFLGPLLMAHYHGAQTLKLMATYMDGIPVKTVASQLPFKTKLNPFLYSNIHLLAKYEDKHNEDYETQHTPKKLTKKAQFNIVTSLYNFIKKLDLKEHSEWGNYYNKTNYEQKAFNYKAQTINTWVNQLKPKTLIDIGGNDGTFVRRITDNLELALVADIDNNAVDFNYKTLKTQKEQYMLPFVLDVLNPAPAIGFNNTERQSFLKRIKKFSPDMVLALAVIHHITLSGNVTFDMSAQFFASFSEQLIIEFPKREDSWVQRLLNTKGEFKEHFDFYSEANFELAFSKLFTIQERVNIPDSKRSMYFLKRK